MQRRTLLLGAPGLLLARHAGAQTFPTKPLRYIVPADQVERIELKVHSMVLELTGKKEPANGLQAKFSVYRGCAAGLIFGRAGEAEFGDAIVARDDVVALPRKVVAIVDDAIDEGSADLTAVLRDGRCVHVFVEHAIGSMQRPMSDAALDAKFASQSDPVLGSARSAALIAACRGLGGHPDVRALVALARP